MNEKNAALIKKCVNIATAVSTVVAGGCLIAACLGVYDGGKGEYTRAAVASALGKIAIPLYIWIALVVLGLLCYLFLPDTKEKRSAGKREKMSKGSYNPKTVMIVKISLIVAGLILVAVGVLTGGMADVLTKAINICTECVGLG